MRLTQTVGRDEEKAGAKGSYNAECAVWGSDGVMIDRWDGNTVSNRSTAEEVLALLNWASVQQPLAPKSVSPITYKRSSNENKI